MWAAIIAVVIPSFVIFFTPNATLPTVGGDSFGTINGRTISRTEFSRAYQETALYYLFNYGEWPGRDESKRYGFDMNRESRSRILLLEEMKRNNILVGDDASALWISSFFRDRKTQVFRVESYDHVTKRVLPEHGLHSSDLDRFAANQSGIQQLITVFGMPGRLVTPQEAKAFYRRGHEEFETEAVIFPATNYLSTITITTNALAEFYTNRLVQYRIQERAQVRYIKFDVTNYWAEADAIMAKDTNLNQNIQAIYLQNGPNYYTDTNGAVMSEEAAKAKIKDQHRQRLAMQEANRKAADFTMLLTTPTNVAPQVLDALALSNKFAVAISEPFGEFDTTPGGLKVFDNFAKAAFALTPEEPYTQALQGEDGFYVIAYHKRLPAQDPPLAVIQEKVTEDYRRVRSMEEANRAGLIFHALLTNGLAQGKSFSNICAEAKVKATVLPKFSLSTTEREMLDDRLDLSTLKELAANLGVGKASPFSRNREGGFLIYMRNRLPANETAMQKDLEDFLKRIRQARTSDSFNEWLNREYTLAKMTMPESEEAEKKAPQPQPRTGRK